MKNEKFTYIKVDFTVGLKGEHYQEIDEAGKILRYCDLNYNTVELPEITECKVVKEEKNVSST